jgi:hypothetical protein
MRLPYPTIGVASGDEILVLDYTPREVGEDWSQGGETRTVFDFSNGGSFVTRLLFGKILDRIGRLRYLGFT